ncbi:hypothetical protein [Methylovorus sp. MP688]|jgi:hypothetical protein|uniref:hypothetical protein n=1 Tax=Methylovorus sp. (strain MP688) TaxID=887061 RepID=UPI00059D4E31|nr:hypothetical protein [Methylovorus sp. MP688]
MVTKFAPEGYERTLGKIVWAFGYAPHFYSDPIGRNFTYDEIFGDILYGVEGVKAKTKVPEKLEIIEQVIAKLHEARAALEANEERAGIMALADAKELFRSIRLAGRK